VKHLKKFNESKDYYEEIPEDYFLESQDDILPFNNREIEMIKSICDETNTKLKGSLFVISSVTKNKTLIWLEYESGFSGTPNVSGVGLSLIYKIKDEYFLFGFNLDRESSSTFYKADQIDGLLKLLNDKL